MNIKRLIEVNPSEALVQMWEDGELPGIPALAHEAFIALRRQLHKASNDRVKKRIDNNIKFAKAARKGQGDE